jgi:hypothetical protein
MSVKDTGQSKQISGFDTKNFVVTMEIASPPGAPPNLLTSKTTMDTWVTPKLPGYEEVTQFGTKLASKMSDFMPAGNALAAYRPDVAKSVTEMSKEMAKMNGIPVYQTLTMRSVQPVGPNLGELAKEGAKEGVKDSIRSRLGGLGGLGRKKEEPAKAEAPKEVTWQEVVLLEQITELNDLSSTVDATKFSVPAGFKQVENDMKKLANRKK